MLVEIRNVHSVLVDGRHRVKRVCILCCDACNGTFERPYKKKLSERLQHFCSVKCVNSCMKNVVETAMMQKHGVRNAWDIPGVLDKVRQTTKERYGVDYPMQSTDIEQRRRENCIEKYGVDNVAKTSDARKKMVESSLTKDWNSILVRTQATFRERYGENVTSSFQLPHVIESSQTSDAWTKRIATMHANGSFQRSKPEDIAYQILVDALGNDNVKRQEFLPGTRWPIDFHINNPDVWIQIDGVYWHGLDVPHDVLTTYETSTSARHRAIFGNFQRDRKQDAYASQLGLRLFRLTDKQIKQEPTLLVNIVRKLR